MRLDTRNCSALEKEVLDRLGQVEAYIDGVRRGQATSPMLPLWNLRALYDQSCHAGHTEISELCTRMESRIMSLPADGTSNSEALLADLARDAAIIRQSVANFPYQGKTMYAGTASPIAGACNS